MKKLLTTTTVITTLITSAALAKTEGNYVGVSLNKSVSSVNEKISSSRNQSSGYGLSYKYAFNSDGFFVAPGFTYERINSSLPKETLKIGAFYGVRADFGYDVTDKVALYVPISIGRISYSINDRSNNNKEHSAQAKSFGLGVSFVASKAITGNLEFNRIESSSLKSDGAIEAKSSAQAHMIKLGVAYNF